MSGEPCMQMVCQFSETVAVKKKTIQFHHPVEHISLTDFCHDLTGNIFSGISRKEGGAPTAFAVYTTGRRKHLRRFSGAIPDISKKPQCIIHNMRFGKFNSRDRRIKVYGPCGIVESGYKKVVRNRKSCFLCCKTDAGSNVIVGTHKSIRKKLFVLKCSKSSEACLDFIIMFIYAVRIERDAMFAERIPVGKKTLLIFIISDDSADIIELCAAMFSDQMFHQRAGCMVVVNSGEVKIRYFIQKRNDRDRGSSGTDYDFFLKFVIGNKSKIQKNSIEV